MKRIFTGILIAALATICTATTRCHASRAPRITVVATTTHIGSIISEIGKDRVEVITLVPGTMCPGHFDIEPGTMKKVTRATLLIHHTWEPWIENLLKKIGYRDITKKQVMTCGNWMIPDVNVIAAKEIAGILAGIDVQNEAFYQKNLASYKRKISRLSEEIRKNTTRYQNINVICSEQQKDFLAWLNFNILTSYGRQEELNIRNMASILSAAGATHPALVIDNLQSGAETGVQIARDLHAGHITLSNFPLNDSYAGTLRQNMLSIDKALHEQNSRTH